MTALTQSRARGLEKWTTKELTLKAGEKCKKNGVLFGEISTGKLVNAVSAAEASYGISVFANEDVDASSTGPLGSVDQPVTVDFGREVDVISRPADGTITAANRYSLCYWSDDQTVSLHSSNQKIAGLIVGFDAVSSLVSFIPKGQY